MKQLILIFAFSLALSACAVDPRKEAAAYATRLEADQSAAAAEQGRQFDADLHALEVSERQAMTPERQAAQGRVIRAASYAGAAALWLVTLALAVGLSWAMIGAGKAAQAAADLRARLIPLDRATGQYPLLLSYTGGGRYSLTNPNTGGVTMLDTRQTEHRQLIQASGAVQLAGVLARSAAHAKEPAAVAMITPVLTDTCEVTHDTDK